MKRQTVFVVVLLSLLVGLSSVAIAEVKGNGLFQGFPIVNLEVNGKAVQSDVPAINFNGRTLVPFRAIGDAIGATVGWDGETQTASLDTPDLNAKVEVLEALFDAVKPSTTGGVVVPSVLKAGVNTVKIVGWGLPFKNTEMGVILVREGSLRSSDGKDLPAGALTVAPNGALLQDSGLPEQRITRWGKFAGTGGTPGNAHVDEYGRFVAEFQSEFQCVGTLHVWLVPVWDWAGFTGPLWDQPSPAKTAYVDLATVTVATSPHLVASGGGSSGLKRCVVDDACTSLNLWAYGLTPGIPVIFRVDGKLIGGLYCDAEAGAKSWLFKLQGEERRVFGVEDLPAEQLFRWAKEGSYDKVVPVQLDEALNSRADASGLAHASANSPVNVIGTNSMFAPFPVGVHTAEVFPSGSTAPLTSATFEVRPQSPITASLDRQVEWHADGRLTYRGVLHVTGLWPDCDAIVSITSGQTPLPDGTLTTSFVFENIEKTRFPISCWVSQEGRRGIQVLLDLPEGP